MGDITESAYILYAFMGFMGLLQLAILGALFRLLLVVGRIQGDINGLRGDAIAALPSAWNAWRNRWLTCGSRWRRIAGCCGRCTSGSTW